MSVFKSFGVNASGMTAERYRLDIISENIANANTTRTEEGTPYRIKIVTFAEKDFDATSFGAIYAKARGYHTGDGVKVTRVHEDTTTDLIKVYDPAHPDADENGYVMYPNVNTITEMTNMIDATRAYEANATAFSASKNMAQRGLQIGQQ